MPRFHHEADETEGEKIKHVEVTSLYRGVNKTQQHPIGYFVIITNPDDQDFQSYFGKAKADVIQPHHLYYPVSPLRHRGKLTLPLCKTCMEGEMFEDLLEKSYPCPYTPDERLPRGVWCTSSKL